MKLTVKGENVNLRTYLESEGFVFPCEGKGLCGRCRIVAADVAPTARDRRFISEEDLASGIRLACDKVINGETEIECNLALREQKAIKYERADAYAVFADNATYIGLADGGEVLDGLVLPPVEAQYAYLRGAAQKETIELFEKHSMAKADVFMLAACPKKFGELTGIAETFSEGQSLDANLMSMPAVDVYLPPVPSPLIAGDLILELADRNEGELIVTGKYFAYLGEERLYCAYISSDDPKIRIAAACYFMERFSPEKAIVIGADSSICSVEGFDNGLTHIPANAAKALDSNRFKAKLDKLARKAESLSLADDETWPKILAEVSKIIGENR